MMKFCFSGKILLTLAFTLTALLSFGQEKTSPTEDLLKNNVANARTDTSTITALINLGQFYKELIKEKIVYKDKALTVANKAMQLSSKINNDVKKADAYDLLSRVADKSGDPASAKKLELEAISCYIQNHNPEKTGMAYKQVAGYYSIYNETDLALRLKYTNLALQAYQASGNKVKQGETFQELGDLYTEHRETPVAIQNLKEGLSVFNSIRYPKLQGIYYILNSDYDEMGDYKQAVYYGLLAVKAAEAVKDTTSQLCTIYNHLAKTYFDMKQMDKAYIYFKLSLKYALINHDNGSYTVVALNLANTLMILNRYQEALKTLRSIKNLEDKELKVVLYSHLLSASEKNENKNLSIQYCALLWQSMNNIDKVSFNRQSAYSALIRYYLDIKQYKKVPALIQSFSIVADHYKSYRNIARVQEYLFALDSAKGNYVSAIRHSERARDIRDTLLNEDKNKSVSQLEVEYETEKKVRELKIQSQHIQLLNKAGELQKVSLQKAEIVRNVIIIGIVMLALLLLISNSRYRIKKRNNLQLEAQQKIINTKNIALNKLVDDKDGLLKEKEWLLKEIHHRVKNNLQIVISLLNSQSAYLNDVEALEALRGSQHRMQSISLIHQKLYQSENLAYIDMNEYICDLVEFLKDSFDLRKNVVIDTDIDLISLDVSQAVPLGLILNEAITNSIKYAFTDAKQGQVFINFFEQDNGLLTLTIEDNGKGLPNDFDIMNCGSLGMNLIRGLCKQLNGELSMDNANGLKLQVTITKRFLFEQEDERLVNAGC